LIKVSGLWFI